MEFYEEFVRKTSLEEMLRAIGNNPEKNKQEKWLPYLDFVDLGKKDKNKDDEKNIKISFHK